MRFGPKGEFTKTIYHHETDSGTPDMFSAPATSKYTKYSMQVDVHQCIQSFKAKLPPCPPVDIPNVVSNSESDSDSDSESTAPSKVPPVSPSLCHDEGGSGAPAAPESDEPSKESIKENIHDFTDVKSPPQQVTQDHETAAVTDQAKLLRWYYCLGHIPFVKI